MGEIRTYRDLVVWQKSIALVTKIYETTKIFPSDEKFGLISQMRRCAVSIPSNIAEGYGRASTSDYIRFLNISRGSLYELETQLEISRNLHFFSEASFSSLEEQTNEIERMLSALIRSLAKKQ